MAGRYTGLILAGGRGSRTGGADKGLLEFNNRALVEYSIAALTPFCDALYINCNRHHDEYSRYGLPLLSDPQGDFPGPLKALGALLPALQGQYFLLLPCDTPGILPEHVQQLIETSRAHPDHWIYLKAGGRDHPLHACIPATLVAPLHAFIQHTGEARLMRALAQLPSMAVEIEADPKLNLNRL
jgi:molybdopterin-guanine dinucleotide biosynthesis protein A